MLDIVMFSRVSFMNASEKGLVILLWHNYIIKINPKFCDKHLQGKSLMLIINHVIHSSVS